MANGIKTGGRVAGTPNRANGEIKQKFIDVFTDLQNNPQFSLLAWATMANDAGDLENLTEFYKLTTKLFPLEITGKDGESLVVQIVRHGDNPNT